jgi:hypothetical protein
VTISQALNVGGNTADGANVSSLTLNGVTVDVCPGSPSNGGLAIGANYGAGSTDGRLILGSNAHLTAGTATAPMRPGLTIGYNHDKAGSATGLVDTTGGSAEIHVDTLYVGNNYNGAGTVGNATGTLTTGAHTVLTANNAYIARGANTSGTVNMEGGLFAATVLTMGSGGTFNFTRGRLALYSVNTYNSTGTLAQHGGTLAPGFDVADRTRTALAGVTSIHGNYALDTAGTLEIELFGETAGTEYDQLRVAGAVNLDADAKGGGALDLKLNFNPTIGDQFTIVDNDLTDPVSGHFAGLSELTTLDETYEGSTYHFQISYCSFGAGNDIMLKVIDELGPTVVPAPGVLLLGGIGVTLLTWLRRRRML